MGWYDVVRARARLLGAALGPDRICGGDSGPLHGHSRAVPAGGVSEFRAACLVLRAAALACFVFIVGCPAPADRPGPRPRYRPGPGAGTRTDRRQRMALFDHTAERMARGPTLALAAEPAGAVAGLMHRYDPAVQARGDDFVFRNGVLLD